MEKYLFYDLEKENGEINPIDEKTLLKWEAYEKSGGKIIIGSNKTISYINGMLNGISSINPIIIAESGAVIQCLDSFLFTYDEDVVIRERINRIKKIVKESVCDSWIQDNHIGFIVYSKNIDQIKESIKEQNSEGLMIRFETNYVCVMPENINYARAIEKIKNIL